MGSCARSAKDEAGGNRLMLSTVLPQNESE